MKSSGRRTGLHGTSPNDICVADHTQGKDSNGAGLVAQDFPDLDIRFMNTTLSLTTLVGNRVGKTLLPAAQHHVLTNNTNAGDTLLASNSSLGQRHELLGYNRHEEVRIITRSEKMPLPSISSRSIQKILPWPDPLRSFTSKATCEVLTNVKKQIGVPARYSSASLTKRWASARAASAFSRASVARLTAT